MRPPRKYKGFGETKTVKEWLKDLRCENKLDILYYNIRAGEPIETAIKKKLRGPGYKLITAFGETKIILEWLKDERCKIHHFAASGKYTPSSLLVSRLFKGMSPEEAIMRPIRHFHKIKAFGEVKSIHGWFLDDRCVVTNITLFNRITKLGIDPETAITQKNLRGLIMKMRKEKANAGM